MLMGVFVTSCDCVCIKVRERLQIVMEMDLRSYKSFIDEQIIRIFGQMENPSQILEHLYLVSIEIERN